MNSSRVFAKSAWRQPIDRPDQLERVERRQVPLELVAVAHDHRDPAQERGLAPGRDVTQDDGLAAGRVEEPAQHLEAGRLAGAVRPEEADDLAVARSRTRCRRPPGPRVVSRRTRLLIAARRPASRTGTLNVLRRLATWIAGAGWVIAEVCDGASPRSRLDDEPAGPWAGRNFDVSGCTRTSAPSGRPPHDLRAEPHRPGHEKGAQAQHDGHRQRAVARCCRGWFCDVRGGRGHRHAADASCREVVAGRGLGPSDSTGSSLPVGVGTTGVGVGYDRGRCGYDRRGRRVRPRAWRGYDRGGRRDDRRGRRDDWSRVGVASQTTSIACWSKLRSRSISSSHVTVYEPSASSNTPVAGARLSPEDVSKSPSSTIGPSSSPS